MHPLVQKNTQLFNNKQLVIIQIYKTSNVKNNKQPIQSQMINKT